MPDFSYEVLQSFFASLRSALSWLGDCISGVFDVVKSSPLYYMPLLLITIIGIVGGIALLVFDVSDRAYIQDIGFHGKFTFLNLYGKFTSLNPYGYYSRYDTSPLGSMLIGNYKKRKQQRDYENKLAQEAYEKVVEEQELLQNRHRLEENEKQRRLLLGSLADEYFENNPNRTKISIEGMEFFNNIREPWYQKNMARKRKKNLNVAKLRMIWTKQLKKQLCGLKI